MNFPDIVEITPEEFEKQVQTWLQSTSQLLNDFRVTHLNKIEGYGGEYEIDAIAEFQVLGGAKIVVLVECKHYKNPVKRDVIMLLDTKVRDTGSHKGIVFTTSNFQSGALEYAEAHGVATVIVRDGQASYQTKSLNIFGNKIIVPPWRPNYKYVGYIVNFNENKNESHHLVADDYPDAINTWLLAK